MLGQRQRRWADVVQMWYKCSVFAGLEARDKDKKKYVLRNMPHQGGYIYITSLALSFQSDSKNSL